MQPSFPKLCFSESKKIRDDPNLKWKKESTWNTLILGIQDLENVLKIWNSQANSSEHFDTNEVTQEEAKVLERKTKRWGYFFAFWANQKKKRKCFVQFILTKAN